MPMTFKISSEFGAVEQIRNNVPHTGIDIPMEIGTKLRSIVDGVVEKIMDGPMIGKGVVIQAKDGTHHIYGHLSQITVKKGEVIHAGREIIGLSGNTGNSTGAHLHYAIQNTNGSYIDPTAAIKALESVTGSDPFNNYLGGQPMPGTFLDWINGLGDKIVGKELDVVDKVSNPVGAWFQKQAVDLAHWFVLNLPDIMGYTAILAAICIVLGAMVGKGGMMKPISIYAGMLIVSMLILSGG